MNDVDIIKKLSRPIKCDYELQGNSLFKKKAGKAKYYYRIAFDDSLDKDLRVLSLLYSNEIPFCVFGNGTNLYITERGYNGLFVDISTKDHRITFDRDGGVVVTANTMVSGLVNLSMEKGFDFSALCGIPGLVGSGVAGNSGWTPSGKSFESFVKRIKVFDFEKNEYIVLNHNELDWSARSSLIKKVNRERFRYFICEIELQAEQIGKNAVYEKYCDQLDRRKEYLKWAYLEGTAGSVWSNLHLIQATGKSFPNILRSNELLMQREFNGARYSKNGNMYFTTEPETTDRDVATLFYTTREYIKNKYNVELVMEMIILDSDGIIDLSNFIKRYYN